MSTVPSVPSLFCQTPISTTKRCEPMHSESPVQRHSRRSPDLHQKFELYYDVTATRSSDLPVGVQALAVAAEQ